MSEVRAGRTSAGRTSASRTSAGLTSVALAPVLDLAAALSFLTRVPIRTGDARTGAGAFAVVGALIGAAGTWPILVFGQTQTLVAGILVVATIGLVSGVLHLDGLSDTADALAARDLEAAERARLDPAAGPAGVVAIGLVLFLDSALIYGLIAVTGLLPAAASLIAAGAASRAAPVVMAVLGRGRTRPGLAAWFVDGTGIVALVGAMATVLAAGAIGSAIASSPAPLIAAAAGLCGGSIAAFALIRLRGRLDGDGLGASVEIAFALALLGAVVS